jgi:DNA-binding NtrC family response regulator
LRADEHRELFIRGCLTAIDRNEIFSSYVVDMVVSDHFLHGGTGVELAAAMKKLKPDVPIVIISGLVDAPEGMEHADLFICKGNSPTEFLQKISELFNMSASANAFYPYALLSSLKFTPQKSGSPCSLCIPL